MGRRSSTKDTLRLRRKREYSQADLALRARVTQALVSALELGRANPTVETLERLARALGVNVAELFAPIES